MTPFRRARLWLTPGLLAVAGLLLSTSNAMNPARAAADPAPVAESRYSLPPMGPIAVYRPAGVPSGVVLALSDSDGWDEGSADTARALAARGALVAGISTPAFLTALQASRRCINPNYGIVALARDLQHRLTLPIYDKPILIGRGEGAALAYATLAAGPDGAYKAVFSQDFTPLLHGGRTWCRSGSLKAAAVRHGFAFAPSRRLPSPWIAMTEGRASPALQRFVARTGSGRLVTAARGQGEVALLSRIRPFLAAPPADVALPGGLPLTIVTDAAAPRTDMMAVLYSGDGGWVGLDKDVAGQLAHAGIPVVGMDSLSYFWSQRTPQGAAQDLSAIIRGYGRRWQRPRVLLVGYSFGADVLPYIVGGLPASQRAQVQRLSLLGLSPHADFQFHLSSWLNLYSDRQYPTIPAIARLRGLPMLCVRGTLENDSACPAIPAGLAQMAVVPGGHHFGRNAPLLVNHMLQGLTI
ncbi:virulence factor family protein [Sphingobium chlorophenolicum]|uniref:Virulence factor family protein n=1 Tax=Sphingobium chlorophenolicum TaxID=46429 RepID=A0A081RDS7_SPHCR|nr:AcvB/VirJ family lysyl-phosphatidylglycerol hydrolase [Sphingobium chlorophenolicum]KEQ53350.1 Virulence factor family protein precursor [Sphingobium chlorophenolicum]